VGYLDPRLLPSPPLPQTLRFPIRWLTDSHSASVKDRSISCRNRNLSCAISSFSYLSCFCPAFAVLSLPNVPNCTFVFTTTWSTFLEVLSMHNLLLNACYDLDWICLFIRTHTLHLLVLAINSALSKPFSLLCCLATRL
jgi:hypothetical protein